MSEFTNRASLGKAIFLTGAAKDRTSFGRIWSTTMTRDFAIPWITRSVVAGTTAALLVVALAKDGATQQCVAINGKVLSAQEVLDLQMYCGSIQCGEYVVEGDFWMNLWTGQRGRVSEACSGETRSYAGGNMVGKCFSDPATGCSVCPGQGLSC